MDYFPASWGLVRKSAGPLLGYAAGRIFEAYKAGKRAARAIDRDSSVPVTWKGSRTVRMPKSTYLKRRAPRRYRRRMYRRPLYRSGNDGYRRVVRSSGPGTLTLPATQQFAASYNSIKLNNVVTADLQSVYEMYRIRKVVLHLVPRIDPANSGLTNNFQTLVQCCCDPSGVSPLFASANQVSAYDNSYSKWVNAGEKYTYTFYPKAINSMFQTGTTTVTSGTYGMNPWIFLDSTGITVDHKELAVTVSVPTASTVALNFDFYWDIHFDVRGIS